MISHQEATRPSDTFTPQSSARKRQRTLPHWSRITHGHEERTKNAASRFNMLPHERARRSTLWPCRCPFLSHVFQKPQTFSAYCDLWEGHGLKRHTDSNRTLATLKRLEKTQAWPAKMVPAKLRVFLYLVVRFLNDACVFWRCFLVLCLLSKTAQLHKIVSH